MNDATSFRQINNIELQIIITSFIKISAKFLAILDNLKSKLYTSIKHSTNRTNYLSIYLITDEQQNLLNEINIRNKIYATGVFFGLIKRGVFLLSIEGAEFLYVSNIFPDFKKLILNENGEKSTLYGNNILKKMVLYSPIDLKKKDFLLVLNEFHEIIGLGLSQTNNEQILDSKPSDLIALNLSDKGYYLRQQ
ncbi:hypothetical protein LCGC14_1420110 [marine sediment metagenome]|uniref:UPF0113 domain-containing protein n=1 Tax=marine sediment metagenome TaxID=412755 RepID=A0A0F9MTB9_9ZZZZ